MSRHRPLLPLAVFLQLFACSGADETSNATASTTTGPGDGSGDGSGDVSATSTSGVDGSDSGTPSPVVCDEPGGLLCCDDDEDRDGVFADEDNAQEVPNRGQADADGDGIGDVIDLCPTVASSVSNSADSDKDGIGNDCDLCPRTVNQYNGDLDDDVPAGLRVRNVPSNADFDGDGIGDACDNCVAVANCRSLEDPDCQSDSPSDGIGDACDDPTVITPGAAGPVGFADADDFDQDGLPNAQDECPRLPLPLADRIACADDSGCPELRTCTPAGVCGHADRDGDGIGDLCDTCPFAANPDQIVDPDGDDDDADFVAVACEAGQACAERLTPRPRGAFDVSASGWCCVTRLVEADDGSGHLIDTLSCTDLAGPFDATNCTRLLAGDPADPTHSRVLRVACDAEPCAVLPQAVVSTPGVVELVPGCAEALEAAGLSMLDNLASGAIAPDTSPAEFEARACWLPQLDSDFDGAGDNCDLCPNAHDPQQQPYVDDDGTVWPNDGALCNGAFSCG